MIILAVLFTTNGHTYQCMVANCFINPKLVLQELTFFYFYKFLMRKISEITDSLADFTISFFFYILPDFFNSCEINTQKWMTQ